ncbi:MAG TPA: hypothetical protein PKK40_07450 [Marmoricola sp.]|nr:hypothetical protein [Marmoricola sp.]
MAHAHRAAHQTDFLKGTTMKFKVLAIAALCALTVGCSNADAKPVSSKADDSQTSTVDGDAHAAATDGSSVYLVECVEDNIVSQPKSFVLSCADSNQSLSDLTWSDWGADQATATGIVSTNNCEPSCAEGTATEQRVKVVASKLVKGEATATYTELHVTAIDGDKTNGLDDEVFTLPGVEPAGDLAD